MQRKGKKIRKKKGENQCDSNPVLDISLDFNMQKFLCKLKILIKKLTRIFFTHFKLNSSNLMRI